MIEIQLESLTENDLEQFTELLKEPGLEQAGIIGKFSERQVITFLNELIADGWHKKITTSNGDFVGIVLFNSRGIDESLIHTKEIGIAIYNKYRGQGIGTAAIKLASDWAAANQITELWSAAYADNIASQKIFENNGFKFRYDADMSMFGLPFQKYYLKSFTH